MKTVKLTSDEIDVILNCLKLKHLCESHCYLDYKTNMCNLINRRGEPACKLKRIVKDIQEKLEG